MDWMRTLQFIALGIMLTGCTAKRTRFFVIPGAPHYQLRYPDGQIRVFPDTTANISNGVDGWVDVGEGITMTLARAYFDPAESRRLQDYLGLESIRFRRSKPGAPLSRFEHRVLESRPTAQPPVTDTISAAQEAARFHRLFFQVVIDRQTGPGPAVLISADSQKEIEALSRDLVRGAGCASSSRPGTFCTLIQQGTAASIHMDVVANGKTVEVLWGGTVLGLVGKTRPVHLWRKDGNRMKPVMLPSGDTEALRLPLLPGDVLRFGVRDGK